MLESAFFNQRLLADKGELLLYFQAGGMPMKSFWRKLVDWWCMPVDEAALRERRERLSLWYVLHYLSRK